MRGAALPERPHGYWEYARALSGETNPHTFLEWLLLGPDRNVKLHLLIPTQFGIALSEARRKTIESVIALHPEKERVLQKQQACLAMCAKCQAPLAEHPDRLRQVVLRVASGQAMNDVWNYDFMLCFLCAECQTVKTCTLFKTSDAIYEALSACVARYGFAEAFVLCDPPRPPGGGDRKLMDSYLERFILLNQFAPRILEATMHVSRHCHHCGKQVKRIKWCQVCRSVRFCKRGQCLAKAARNGHEQHLCVALRERHLFHVEDAWYVDTTGEHVLVCNRYRRLSFPPAEPGGTTGSPN